MPNTASPLTGKNTQTQPHTHAWDWPTLGLMGVCYGLWGGAVFLLPGLSLALAWGILTVALVLHSSLSHEVLHGHPFPSRQAGEALVIVSPGLFIPYIRFRDTHLAHHMDARLTDPYDDPESNYLDPAVWNGLHRIKKCAYWVNNTLLGRMLIGPLISQYVFMRADARAIRHSDRAVLQAWLLHMPGVILVVLLVFISPMPLWLYVLSAYAALSVLKIRTFLEHQAHQHSSARSVIIEDRGLLAFLFLNNNLHLVHHMHPRVAWYRLPALYRANKKRYVARNQGYVYRSYHDVFARYFLKTKDPVAHPLWPMR